MLRDRPQMTSDRGSAAQGAGTAVGPPNTNRSRRRSRPSQSFSVPYVVARRRASEGRSRDLMEDPGDVELAGWEQERRAVASKAILAALGPTKFWSRCCPPVPPG